MEHITITWETLVALCSSIICIGSAITYIKKLKQPLDDMKNKVNEHSVKLKEIEERLNENDDAVIVQNKCLLALISHAINGNSIDKLKEAKASLEDYLLKR